MTWYAVAATAGSALLGGIATNRAASTSADATRQGIASQERMYNQTRADQEPYRQAGEKALNALVPLAMDYRPFTAERMYNDPGYGFRLSEGQKMIDRQAAARGGLISGGALKAAARYGQDYASGEYTNALNRYLAERNAQLGPLQSLAGVGQSATNYVGNAAQNMGQAQAQGAQAIGNAQASGYIGGSNVLNQALQGYGNYYLQNQRNQLLQNMNLGNQYGYGNVYGIGGGGSSPLSSDLLTATQNYAY
jgi:hypothetical protein